MKQLLSYSLLLVASFYLSSCKSSSQYTLKDRDMVSIEDFHPLDQNISKGSKAVILNENVDLRREALRTVPWYINGTTVFKYYSSVYGWAITIEDKIKLLTDNINNEPFAFIDYFCPHSRLDLMTKCEMWLYSTDNTGKVSKRKIKRKEITRKRLNDSICRVQLNVQESLLGKILTRKYVLIKPYYNTKQVGISEKPTLAKIAPLTFQKDIPLLHGKYEIFLPDIEDVLEIPLEYQIIKSGNGDLTIKNEKLDVTYLSYWTSPDFKNNQPSSTSVVRGTYKATKIAITVSNIMPLPKESNMQPLGVEFVTIQGEGIH